MNNISNIMKLGGAAVVLILLFIFNPWAFNDSGYRIHVQQVGGSEHIQFEPGLFYAGFFSTTTVYPDIITVQYADTDNQMDGISYSSGLIEGQFKDGTYASIGFTVKWELPDDDESMMKIHKDYRSTARLAQSLAEYSKECMTYSTPLMDSERHYSGGKSELKDYFQFQLRNGQYILDQEEVLEKDTAGEIVKRSYENTRRIKPDGSFLLAISDVQLYKIKPNFVAITHVDYAEIVDEKLTAKVEQSTKEAISKQTLVTAQQEALTAKAEGERLLAETRATEEAGKLKAVIQMQKEVELARLSAEQARFDAQRIKWEGDARASANRALVNAGLTPDARAKYDKETAIGVAAEFAKMKWPEMMIFGGGNGSPMNPIDALGIDAMLNVQRKMSDKK